MIVQIAAVSSCLVLGVAVIPPIAAARGGAGACVSTPVAADVDLDLDQRSNLAVVIATGDELQAGHEGKVIAVMTALTESSLRNVDHGDDAGPDSRGLFEQRNGWGPFAVRMDPRGASGLFYTALLKVSGWMALEPWMAAQTVQRSAFSDGSNYKANYNLALQLVGVADQGACGLTTDIDDLPGAEKAVARAMSMVGQHGYYQLCARLAANIWGRPHMRLRIGCRAVVADACYWQRSS